MTLRTLAKTLPCGISTAQAARRQLGITVPKAPRADAAVALLRERPDLTDRELKEQLGCSKNTIQRARRILGIAPRWGSVKRKVLAALREHPGFSHAGLARVLGCNESYVLRIRDMLSPTEIDPARWNRLKAEEKAALRAYWKEKQ